MNGIEKDQTLDFINNKIRQKSESRNTFDDVDKAIEFYNETHPDANLTLHKQPSIRDFYKPANEQKYYEVTIVTVLSVVSGYLMFKVYKHQRVTVKRNKHSQQNVLQYQIRTDL